MVRGTLSQTAVGRLASTGSIERNFVGFWYRAYRPTVTTTVSLPTIETTTRTRLDLELRLESAGNDRPYLPRAFYARIRYNATVLKDLAGAPPCDYDGDDCVIEIRDTARVENGVIARIPVITTLGNAIGTDLVIEEFTWETFAEERFSVVRQSGRVDLLDICEEGDHIRLIESGAASRLAIRPNPARTTTTIDLTPSETGPVRITLVDPLGSERFRLPPIEVEGGRYTAIDLDLSSVPSGFYRVVVEGPNTVMSERLIVQQ